jgi:diguanylate cyclase (GGDEF)-like protein/PAS domain S-box-containing protein
MRLTVENAMLRMKTTITHALLVGLLAFVSASLAVTLFVIPPAALPIIWPVSGVVLAALLLAPTAAWPLLLLSAGLATGLAQLWAGSPPLVNLALTLAHLAAAHLAATLVRRWSAAPLAMTRLRDLVGLVTIAALASNALTALLGAIVAWASLGAPFWLSWQIWFVADGMSILLLTPLALSWLGPAWPAFHGLPRRRVGEAVALLLALLLVSGGVFTVHARADSADPLGYYLLFPLLIWAVVRFQMRGATLAALIFASLITLGVIDGQGPFVAATASLLAAMLAAQRYLTVIVPSAYVMAALVTERATEHAAQLQAREDLRESEARFRTIFFEDGAVKLLIDPKTGRIVEANQAAVDFYGYPYAQITQMQIQAINQLPPEAVMREMQQAVQRHKNMFTFQHRLASGEVREVEVSANTLEIAHQPYLLSFIHDVTERTRAEAALRESEQRWQFALNAANDGMWDWNVQTGEVFFSDRWQTMLGYAPGEVEGHVRSWERMVHPDDLPQVMAILQAHLDGHTASYECEHRCRTKAGDWLWILDRGQVIARDAAGHPLRAVGTHTDVSARRALEAKLRTAHDRYAFQANHDPLTGLLNRLAITDHVDAELARASRSSFPLSLALLDIDHFKAVNDQHGHLLGDRVLRHLAQILTETVRPYDWAGRWGGEEFLVVLASTTLDDATAIAERLCVQIAASPLRLPDGMELRLTVSIGVASTGLSVEGAGNAETLFQQADAALYAAKHAGRNQVSCAAPALMGGVLMLPEALGHERIRLHSRDQEGQYARVPSSN